MMVTLHDIVSKFFQIIKIEWRIYATVNLLPIWHQGIIQNNDGLSLIVHLAVNLETKYNSFHTLNKFRNVICEIAAISGLKMLNSIRFHHNKLDKFLTTIFHERWQYQGNIPWVYQLTYAGISKFVPQFVHLTLHFQFRGYLWGCYYTVFTRITYYEFKPTILFQHIETKWCTYASLNNKKTIIWCQTAIIRLHVY